MSDTITVGNWTLPRTMKAEAIPTLRVTKERSGTVIEGLVYAIDYKMQSWSDGVLEVRFHGKVDVTVTGRDKVEVVSQ